MNASSAKRMLALGIASATGLAVVAAGTAYGAGLITSGDIKNDTVRSKDVRDDSLRGKDVRNGSIGSSDLRDGSVLTRDLHESVVEKLKGEQGPAGPQGPEGPQGPVGPQGPAGTAEYVGENWSTIDRNVYGGGIAQLRSGPSAMGASGPVLPLYGIGSLGFTVPDGTSSIHFGNQVDFFGDALSTVTEPGFSVFTIGDAQNAPQDTNLPNLKFETFVNGTSGYSTLTFVPPAIEPADFSTWKTFDASQGAQWYFTGAQGTATGCNQTTYCTWDEIQAAAPDATIISVGIAKGRDHQWHGAVDGLRLNAGTVYDFEPFGVSEVAE